jgi:PIN domain nuclease of toxin-antitoxin system
MDLVGTGATEAEPPATGRIGHEDDVIGISAISCWEIAKLVEIGRQPLVAGLSEWFEVALGFRGVTLYPSRPR